MTIPFSSFAQCPDRQRDVSNIGSAYIEELGSKTVFGNFTNASDAQYVNDGRAYFFGDIDNEGHIGDGFGYEYIYRCDPSLTTISGQGTTEFNILHVENSGDVDLNTSIRIKTNLHFQEGIIHTDRNNFVERVFFNEGASHSGSSDVKHLDGTAARQGEGSFIFPVGDGDHMSPIQVRGVNPFDVFITTYHSTNQPNSQFLSKGEFPVDSTDFDVVAVQDREFWTLLGGQSTRVTLFWTQFSQIDSLVENISDLIVVGWDGAKWVNLGNTGLTQIFGTGTIASSSVIPNRYEAFTFGVLDSDGDGIADSEDDDPFDPCHPDPTTDACLNRICVDVDVKVYLEGALQSGGIGEYADEMGTLLNQYGYLPGQRPVTLLGVATDAGQPYDRVPWEYSGNEGLEFDIFSSGRSELYPPDAVDWILISLRTGVNVETTVCTKAALLLANGDVMLTEFFDCCDMLDDEYYIVIEHRNHLSVMTPVPVTISDGLITYDFTSNQSYIRLFGNGQKEIRPGTFVMYAGNGDQILAPESPKDINSNDVSLWAKDNGKHSGYYFQDYNLSGDVNVHDKAIWLTNNGVFTDVDR